LAHLAGTSGGR